MRVTLLEKGTKLSHIKGLRFEGLLLRANVPNANKRIYPKNVILKAINDIQPVIKEGKMYGSLEHPQGLETPLNTLSHKILKTYWKNDNELWAVAEVVSKTIGGETLKTILSQGIECGFSTRGLGEVKLNPETGISEVTEWKMKAADIVSDPSNQAKCLKILEGIQKELKPNVVDALVNQVESEYQERATFLDNAINDTLAKMNEEVNAKNDLEGFSEELLEELCLKIMKSALHESKGRQMILDRTLDSAEDQIRDLAIEAIKKNENMSAAKHISRLNRLQNRKK